jgi:parvulin-like peptidyl-prolyl isomerase
MNIQRLLLLNNMQLKTCFAFLLSAAALFAQLPLRQDPKDVVATVDGRDITRAEVQQIMFVAGPQFVTLFQSNPKVALYQWFLQQYLGKEGEKLKLDQVTPFKEQLEAKRMEILADAYLNTEMNGYKPPAADVQKYYSQNGNRYQRVRASGVYISFKPKENQGTGTSDLAAAAMAILMSGKAQRTEEEARALALDIAKRLRAGEDVAKLADEFSEDAASKAKGGDFGYISFTSSYPAEFNSGALALAKGQVSEPIRLPTGFYVLRADDRGIMPLNDAIYDIETELRKIHLNEFMTALNDRLRPVIKDNTLIVQPPAAAGPQK